MARFTINATVRFQVDLPDLDQATAWAENMLRETISLPREEYAYVILDENEELVSEDGIALDED